MTETDTYRIRITLEDKPKEWARSFGIGAIVLGASGVLWGVWGIASPHMSSSMYGMLPAQMRQNTGLDAMQGWKWTSSCVSMAATVLAAGLATGGILLMMRIALARPVLLGWAYAKIPLVLVSAITALLMQKAQMDAMSKQQSQISQSLQQLQGVQGIQQIIGALTGQQSVAGPVAVVLMIGKILFGWGLAAFVIVWFLRRRVRDEMGQWDTTTGNVAEEFVDS